MSKAVTNEEVEDVLSSIRRLVSEDKRPLAGLSAAPREPVVTAQVKAEPAPERLVLTPALRVAETASADEAGPLDLGSVARETWMPLDDDAEAQVDDGPLVQFSDAGEDAIGALVQDALETQADVEGSGLSDGDCSDEGYWDDEEGEADVKQTLDHGAVRYGDATPEVGQPATYGDDGDWDDETAADDDQWEVEPETHETAGVAGTLSVEPARPAKPEPVVQDANILIADVPLTAKIAALGAAIGKSPQDWEPDGDESNDLAATHTRAMAWEDDVELDAKGSPLRADNMICTCCPSTMRRVVQYPEHSPNDVPRSATTAGSAGSETVVLVCGSGTVDGTVTLAFSSSDPQAADSSSTTATRIRTMRRGEMRGGERCMVT